MGQQLIERQDFQTAAELRNWLNTIDDADTVHLSITAETMVVRLIETTLSDGSTVQDLAITFQN